MELANPTTNYGSSTTLRADAGSTATDSYLRFTVSGLGGAVQSARLRLYATSGTTDGPAVYQVPDTSWAETGITWNTKPAASGSGVDDKGRIDVLTGSTTLVEFDVTSLVSGNGTYSFALKTTSTDGIDFRSREATSNRPELVVTWSGTVTATPTPIPTPIPTENPDPTASATLLAAGDIATCAGSGDEATAALLDGLTGTIAALGDLAYLDGTPDEFAQCYEPSWGRHKSRTRPATGNHEYHTADAAGYFGYFGAIAGDPTKGYYSYDLGAWHIVVLNSNCSRVGGCDVGSVQEQWLRADLAAHPTACTLAYWHHARFSFGRYTDDPRTQALWQALYEAGAEIVLSGHDHNYQRYAPQDAAGVRDDVRGIREFVVGTGGAGNYLLGTPSINLEKASSDSLGVLKLTLHPTGYDWEFIPQSGESFTDTGSGVCH